MHLVRTKGLVILVVPRTSRAAYSQSLRPFTAYDPSSRQSQTRNRYHLDLLALRHRVRRIRVVTNGIVPLTLRVTTVGS